MDLAAADVDLPADLDPIETAAEIRRRYDALYSAVTHEEVFVPSSPTASRSGCGC